MGGAGLTRRRLLVGGAGLGLAAALGVTTTGSPFGGGGRSIAYWHLFGGGDGVRMREMLDTFAKSGTDIDAAELILPWGNPYYTKLCWPRPAGASPWQQVRRITLPLLRSTTMLVVTLQVIASLKVFDQIYLLQQGQAGPENSTRPAIQYIYESGFTQYRLGYASALSFVFLLAVVAVSLVLFRITRPRSQGA